MRKIWLFIIILNLSFISYNVSALETIKHSKNVNYISTSQKTIKVIDDCEKHCRVTIIIDWHDIPKLKSYDLLGVLLEDTKLLKVIRSHLYADYKMYDYINMKTEKNGISVTYKLPYAKFNMRIILELEVTKYGNVAINYQHAKKSIMLEDSKRFNFIAQGYGGVFSFNGIAKKNYDSMDGLILNLD